MSASTKHTYQATTTTATWRHRALRLRRSIIAVALLATLSIASSAQASSLVFTKPDGNVWLANPDGSGQYQVTLDGTPSNPYSAPSQANDGTIEAVRGSGNGAQIYRMSQNGTNLSPPFSTAAPGTGPLDAVISPDGTKVGFWAITGTNPCYPWICAGTTRSYQLSYADHYVDPATFNPGYAGWSSFGAPAWMGASRNMLFTSTGYIWYYDLGTSGSGEPVQWLYADDPAYQSLWDGYNGTCCQIYFEEGAVSQDGTRMAVVINNGYDSQSQIALFSAPAGDLATGNPPANPTLASCVITPPDGSSGGYPGGPQFDSLSWSPDDSSLAYEYNGTIYVATIASLTNCSADTTNQVISPGSDPYWGPANVNPPPRRQPPPPPPAATTTARRRSTAMFPTWLETSWPRPERSSPAGDASSGKSPGDTPPARSAVASSPKASSRG